MYNLYYLKVLKIFIIDIIIHNNTLFILITCLLEKHMKHSLVRINFRIFCVGKIRGELWFVQSTYVP